MSDRAARYRANADGCRPRGPRICVFCGSQSNVEVHHIDGFEAQTDRSNLAWACRRCNTQIGVVMVRAGMGTRTQQYNPRAQGAKSLRQWVSAVMSMKGKSDAMDLGSAVEMIHLTAPERRSEFAQQIWQLRRRHGTDRRR